MKVGSNSQHAPWGNPPIAKARGFWQMPFSTPAKETNVTFKQKYLISAFGDLQQISLINRGLPRSVSLLRTRWSPSPTQSIKYDWRKKRFKNFELHPRRKSNYPCASRRGVPVTPRPSVYHAPVRHDRTGTCTYVPLTRRAPGRQTWRTSVILQLLTRKLILGSGKKQSVTSRVEKMPRSGIWRMASLFRH